MKSTRLRDLLGGVLIGIIACLILIACGSDSGQTSGSTAAASNQATTAVTSFSNNGSNAAANTNNSNAAGSNQNVAVAANNQSVPTAAQATSNQANGNLSVPLNPSGNYNQDILNVIKAVRPGVVLIAATITTNKSGGGFGGIFGGGGQGQQVEQGIGTGSIITPDGYILTNNHVVEGSTRLAVSLPDGRTYQGRLIGREGQSSDMAIVKIDPKNNETFPVVKLGDSSNLQVGEGVVAIGNALGLPGGPTVTQGIVSAIGRSIQEPNGAQLTDLIQTDAAINPGNSGGPLLNLRGELVGMNTAAAVDPEQGVAANGIGFALSINSLRSYIDALTKGGGQAAISSKPFMGILPQTMTAGLAARYQLPVDTGVLIARVDQNSPAAKAGWKAGDIIVQMDGTAIKSTNDLANVLSRHKAGDQVNVTLVGQNGQQRNAPITFGSVPNQ
ncbi:MAG TPA: trypsin-like peptidase domain-containing protein [Chloroflexia bacterium]|nr:trypsin-like peptidase domain-containing protein [Chloroflexia bacterium]